MMSARNSESAQKIARHLIAVTIPSLPDPETRTAAAGSYPHPQFYR